MGRVRFARSGSGKRFPTATEKKRAVIDEYGDTVTCATLKGDHYRIRHDNFKWTLHEQAAWCRFALHTEPMHKFLPFITQRSAFLRSVHMVSSLPTCSISSKSSPSKGPKAGIGTWALTARKLPQQQSNSKSSYH